MNELNFPGYYTPEILEFRRKVQRRKAKRNKEIIANVAMWAYLFVLFAIVFFSVFYRTVIIAEAATESYPQSYKPTVDIALGANADEMGCNNFSYDSNIPLNEEIQYWICSVSSYYSIDPYLIYAIMKSESGFDAAAKSADGKDHGIMQIRTVNHKWINKELGYKLNYFDAYDNTLAGVYMFNKLIEKHQDRGIHYVLMCYNMGEGTAASKWKQGIRSSKYSNKIMKYYNELKGVTK